MNRKRTIVFGITVLMVLALALGTVSAANVHLKGGKHAEPSFYDGGLTLTASGDLAGLGNEDLVINLEADGDVTATCTNRGGHQAPGQNPAPVTVGGHQDVAASEIKNGNLSFNVTTEVPADPWFILGAPDCPNGNWTEEITDVAFNNATITVEQPLGDTVLTVVCTFTPPTEDDGVPKQNVECFVVP